MARTSAIVILMLTVACVTPQRVLAVKIADITRISGQRTNVLTGWGLVVGLKGTGDGGDFEPAMRPLAAMLTKYADPSTLRQLNNVQNVALVMITATIPAEGVRNGDRVDCYVTSMGKASSLKNGRLAPAPMLGPTGAPVPVTGLPFALADGHIELEDASTPTVGVIKKGCVMDVDLDAESINAGGQFELVLEGPSASWTTASAIAKIINEAADALDDKTAVVKDQKTVIVTIPPAERAKPDIFISRIQRLPVSSMLLVPEARVKINARTGTIVMTGDVEISPVIISHKGLTITTVNPAPKPTERTPVTTEKNAIAIDTTGTGGAKLNDLLTVFDQLKVPSEDRITIIKELHQTGKLHAKMILE